MTSIELPKDFFLLDSVILTGIPYRDSGRAPGATTAAAPPSANSRSSISRSEVKSGRAVAKPWERTDRSPCRKPPVRCQKRSRGRYCTPDRKRVKTAGKRRVWDSVHVAHPLALDMCAGSLSMTFGAVRKGPQQVWTVPMLLPLLSQPSWRQKAKTAMIISYHALLSRF